MPEWNCNAKKIAIGETITHSRNEDRGITVILQDVSPVGSHKAAVGVYFYWDQDPDELVIINPGSYESYTDPDGVEWRVHVDSTSYMGVSSTANIQICYEEAAPAEGQIVSIDTPAEAKAGQILETYTTIKNIGGTKAMFFLRFYDGATLIHEGLPGWIDPGATIADLLENPKMPDHTWNGRVDLMRVV